MHPPIYQFIMQTGCDYLLTCHMKPCAHSPPRFPLRTAEEIMALVQEVKEQVCVMDSVLLKCYLPLPQRLLAHAAASIVFDVI